MKRPLRSEVKHSYNIETQHCLLSYMISDLDVYCRSRSIVKDEYFDDPLASTVRFILQHTDEYRTLPTTALIQAKTGQSLIPLTSEDVVRQRDWYFSELEAFCRYRAMENAVFDGIELLRDGEAGEVERRVKEAMTIRLVADLGTDYFLDPGTRLRRMLDRSFVPTGWAPIDDKLFGGFSRGGLNVFCGSSGMGKSLVLQNLAVNWVLDGHVVIYFTLELAEDLVALRIDSMLTKKSTKQVFATIAEVELQLGMTAKKAGRLFIKKMPEGSTTANDLRACLKEFEIQTGRRPDAIIIDYLDLMYPNDRRIDASDLFVKDKFVSEQVRALMYESNAFGATASQLNRGAIEAQGEFMQSHIAGGISKVNTADNVIALYAPHKDRGEYEMFFLKTRSSSGQQQRVKMHYDPATMRITAPASDPDRARSYEEIRSELEQEEQEVVETSNLMDLMSREQNRNH